MRRVLCISVAFAMSLGAKEMRRHWKRDLVAAMLLNLMWLVPMVFVFCSPMMWTDLP